MATPVRSKAAHAPPTRAMLTPKKNAPKSPSQDVGVAVMASVAHGLSVVKSFREEHFDSNESSATTTLQSLMECIKCCIKTKNCGAVLDVIQFLQKANSKDAWILAASQQVLPRLPAIITEDLASDNHLSLEESSKIVSHLFELGLDFVDVDSNSTVIHLSNLATLACLSLFHSRPPTGEFGSSIEKDYVFDCLFRQACFLLCNIVEAFPQTVESLYASLNNRTFELVRLSCDAPESSIRRSVVRLTSILAVRYPDLRSAMHEFLSETFNQSDILSDLFRSIDPSQEEEFGERVDCFRENVSNMQDSNDCFVTKACTLVVSNESLKSNHCYDLCNIDWDKNSFAVYVEGIDPIRIPWYNVCGTRCDYQSKSIVVDTKEASMKSLRIEFKSCTEHAMRRIAHRLRSRITNGKSTDMAVPVQRKVSQALAVTEVGDGPTIFSKLSRDGTLLQKCPSDHEDEIIGEENKGNSVSFNTALLETPDSTRDSTRDTPSVSTPRGAGHISHKTLPVTAPRQPTKTLDIEEDTGHTRGIAVQSEIEKSIAGPSAPPTLTNTVRVSNRTLPRIDDDAWDENTNMRQESEEFVPLASQCEGIAKGFHKRSFPPIDPKFLGNSSLLHEPGSDVVNELGIPLHMSLNAAKKTGTNDTDDDMGGRKTGALYRGGGKKKTGTLKSPAQLFSSCIPENEGETLQGIEGNREVDVVTGVSQFSIDDDAVGRGKQREGPIAEEGDGELFTKLIALVNSTVRMRNRQSRLLIEKSRAKMEKIRDEAKKEKKELQQELKDELKNEYTDERTKYSKYGHDLKVAVRQRLKAVGGVAKKVTARRKGGVQLSGAAAEDGARAKMSGHLTDLGRKLRSRYEKNVLVRRRSAQKATSLMRGISSLMMANAEE